MEAQQPIVEMGTEIRVLPGSHPMIVKQIRRDGNVVLDTGKQCEIWLSFSAIEQAAERGGATKWKLNNQS